ncbi:MAG: adenylate kinase [Bacteroidales bacterium]|nr:adenylate kinase [Bacteroidales bacterium]
MLNVVIFGAPGSGKGTQSAFIAEKYGLEHLSTGDLLRDEQKTRSELGLLIESYISQGNLVPDELIINMLAKVLDTEKNNKGYIFDGFPRTTAQAEALKVMLAERDMTVSIMLDLDVAEAELIDRLLKRGFTSGRSDDNFDTIQKRIQVYHLKTAPVKNFYKKEGLATEIQGVGTMDEIFGRITKAIDAL